MRTWLDELLGWLWAVARKWQLSVTGLVATIWQMFGHPSTRAVGYFAAGCLLVACFLVWRDERRRLRETTTAANLAERSARADLSLLALGARRTIMTWILQSHKVGWGTSTVKRVQDARTTCVHGEREDLGRALVVASMTPFAQQMQTAVTYLDRADLLFESYLAQVHEVSVAGKLGNPANEPSTQPLQDAREALWLCCRALEAVVDPELVARMKREGAWLERQ